MGVIKLAEAPKQIAIMKHLVGSGPGSNNPFIYASPILSAIGVKIIATAALDINADAIKVMRYKIAIIKYIWYFIPSSVKFGNLYYYSTRL